MFFRAFGRYLYMLYAFYFSFLLILYFTLFKDYGFANETYTIYSVLEGCHRLNPLIVSALILFYIVNMVAVVRFLTDLSGKRISFSFYLFYILTTISGLFFYALSFYVVYFPLKGLIKRLKEVSLTEIPLVIAYVALFVLVVLLWKVVTYWKIRARLNYFTKFPGFKFLFLPINGLNLKDFLKFVFFVLIVVGTPLFSLFFAVLNKNTYLLFFAIGFSLLVFPFAKLYMYYLLLEKTDV